VAQWRNGVVCSVRDARLGRAFVTQRTDCHKRASYREHMINANTPYCPPNQRDTPLAGRAAPAQVANVKRAVPVMPVAPMAATTSYRHASGMHCPMCAGALIRTPRRLQDRLWSVVQPSNRFRCVRFSCQWVGNVRRCDAAKPTTRGAMSRLQRGATWSALLFAGVGVVALVLFATTVVFEPAEVQGAAMPSGELGELMHRPGAGSDALSGWVQLDLAHPVNLQRPR